MGYKAIVAGASGLVGSKLVEVLLSSATYQEVVVLVRKRLGTENPKLTQVVIDFDKIDNYADAITGHALFCCLGSTRKKTPDLKEYREIDHDYPLALARIAAKNGIGQYHLVSAIGANASSSNFYTKMKGETEEAVKQAGIKAVMIYQPSFLAGDRNESRPVEKFAGALMKVIDPLLMGSLKKYRSIPAETVATAMYKQSLLNSTGVFTYASDKIKELA